MRKILACLILTCLAWAPPALAKETIKIGAVLGVTGPAANLGGPEARALDMLVQEINGKSGIRGNPVELIVDAFELLTVNGKFVPYLDEPAKAEKTEKTDTSAKAR